ncbi:MAG: single-stranded DNA-binding protein [Actinomycetia bacterium]|nr:single-stranded DNA-binding protein [Actinomycetes bacterium]
MNRVWLIGRLTQDPDLRLTPDGTAVTRFTLAVDRRPGPDGQRTADFIDCVAWRKLAEIVADHLRKGRLVAVQGRLQIRTYETQDGQKRRAAEVVAETVEFLPDGRKASSDAAGAEAEAEPESVPF